MLIMNCISNVSGFLKKVCIPESYALSVLEAAKSETYVETVGNKADGLHHHLDKIVPELLTEKFFECAAKKIKGLRLSLVDLVADVTEENFYGKRSGLYVHPWTGEKGVVGKFRFLVMAVLFRNMLIPFYVVILPVGSFKAEYLGQAMDWFNTLGIKARKIILDRGFYSGEIIDVLQMKNMNYLIFVPKKKLYRCMLESAPGKGCVVQHEIKYAKNKNTCYTSTNFALVRNVKGYDWVFATSLVFKDMKKYVRLYKQRWNIETMFRVHDEAQIKTKSHKAVTRLFYFITSMLLLILWNVCYKTTHTFKLFTIQLYETLFFKKLGIDYTFDL